MVLARAVHQGLSWKAPPFRRSFVARLTSSHLHYSPRWLPSPKSPKKQPSASRTTVLTRLNTSQHAEPRIENTRIYPSSPSHYHRLTHLTGCARRNRSTTSICHFDEPPSTHLTVIDTDSAPFGRGAHSNRQSRGIGTSGAVHERYTRNTTMRILEDEYTDIGSAGARSTKVYRFQCSRR